MISQNIALSNWSNGVIMITVFGLVCLILIGVIINFVMNNDKKKKDVEE
jgi:hypothetical protein